MRISKNLSWGLATFAIGFSATEIIISALVGKTDPFVYVLNGIAIFIAATTLILIRRDDNNNPQHKKTVSVI